MRKMPHCSSEPGTQVYESQVKNARGDLRDVVFHKASLTDGSGGVTGLVGVILDITEGKRADAALKASEEKYKFLIENANDIVWTFDLKTMTYSFISSSVERFLGYTVDETMGMTLDDAFSPETKRNLLAGFNAVVTGKAASDRIMMEAEHIAKNGSRVWMEINAVLKRDEPGKPVAFTGTTRDITGRKQAEAALRAEESRMRAISESAQDAILMMNPQGAISFWNQAAERIFGYTADEAIGQNLHRFIVPQRYHAAHQHAFPRFLETGQGDDIGKTLELEALRRDGLEISVELSLSALELPDGWHSVGILRDISERKRAEKMTEIRLKLIEFAAGHTLDELLTRSLDEVCVVVNSAIGFYHFVETDQKTLSLQQWSTATLERFCKTQSKGTHYGIDQAGVWVDCVHARKAVIHNDYRLLPHKKGLPEGHAEVVRELVVPVMRDGKFVAILGVGNKPFDYTEKDIEAVAFIADVTWEIVKQKRAEADILEANRQLKAATIQAEKASIAKSEFLANMSHEIRTPHEWGHRHDRPAAGYRNDRRTATLRRNRAPQRGVAPGSHQRHP